MKSRVHQNHVILRLQWRFFTAPPPNRAMFRAARIFDARFPCDQKLLADGDFLCDENGQNTLCHKSGQAKGDRQKGNQKQNEGYQKSRAAKRGGFKRGVSRSGLVLPFLSFFVLFGTIPIFSGFSRFARGRSGDFPDSSFSSFSAYQEHLQGTVPKGSATQSGPFPKKVGKPPV